MRIGVVGINHKSADLRVREQWARACHRRFSCPSALGAGASVVLLSTCNRTEVYFSAHDMELAHISILQALDACARGEWLYSRFDYECFLHGVRVASGLDSAIVGETEIQGQVRGAYETAASREKLPAELHFMFQKVLKISKEVRTQLALGRGDYDVEHAIHEMLVERDAQNILFVGASEINRKIFRYLSLREVGRISLCNRSENHARAFLGKLDAEVLAWHEIDRWRQFDCVVFGTRCPDYLLTPQLVHGRGHSPSLLIDLSVPRNVHPALGRRRGITLLNVDQINSVVSQRRLKQDAVLAMAEDLSVDRTLYYLNAFEKKEKVRAQWVAVGT